MKWMVAMLLVLPFAQAKVMTEYAANPGQTDYRDRLTLPHIYPGQTITSHELFLADAMRPGTSTVRWTKEGAFSVTLDRVHLIRGDYTLFIKSKYGPEIRQLPFATTKIYLRPDYYQIKFDKETFTVRLARYAD